ncbi:MAG TPA: calcium-binding protein [Capillimicrobium sp.]|nr:calcium-binding protein [Capillimicrobium sp.]
MTATRTLVATIAVSAAAAAGAAASASAATVAVGVTGKGMFKDYEAVYTAAPGEANRLTVERVGDDDKVIRLTDPGATITPGEKCTSIDPHTARCSVEGVPYRQDLNNVLFRVRALTGDGDDRIRSIGKFGPLLTADAGAGDDVVRGSDRGDVIDGGGGTDRLFGRGRSDTITDGDASGSANADVLDGGAGPDADEISYAGRTAPVTVNLADPGPDGEAGEGDTVRGFRYVVGGSGDDHLEGDGAENGLDGGPGDDHLDGNGGGDLLSGREGDDLLHGHAGADFLSGGPGADAIRGDRGDDVIPRPASADTVSCGKGREALVQAGRGVTVAPSCEELVYEFDEETGRFTNDEGTRVELPPYPARATATVLRFRVGCPKPALADGLCADDARQQIRLRSGDGRLLGAGSLDRRRYRRLAPREDVQVFPIDVRLTRAGRRLLGRPGGAQATVALKTDDFVTVSWRARLRAGSVPRTG